VNWRPFADATPALSTRQLDEPTNFLDREALGGLSIAIRDWAGAVCIISHNLEFVNALCPEIWNVDAGRLTHIGKVAIIDDAFDDVKPSRVGSRMGTPRGAATPANGTSGVNTAATSAANSAAPSDADGDVPQPKLKKKKKLTRNEQKATEARRAKRKLDWLSYGGPKPEDTGESGSRAVDALRALTDLVLAQTRTDLTSEFNVTTAHLFPPAGFGFEPRTPSSCTTWFHRVSCNCACIEFPFRLRFWIMTYHIDVSPANVTRTCDWITDE